MDGYSGPQMQKGDSRHRPGEKLHEEMITGTDALNTIEFERSFVILHSMRLWDVDNFTSTFDGKQCPFGFKYNSRRNTDLLTVEQIRELIKLHVNPNFEVL